MNKRALSKRPAADISISYADFVRLCHVDDPDDWMPGLRVAFDGVWVTGPTSEYLVDEETRAVLSEHPDGDPSRPVVVFPCTLGDIEARIVDTYGGGFIDPMDLADFVASKLKAPQQPDPSAILETRERNNLLRVIAALMKEADIPEGRGAAQALLKCVEMRGFDSPKKDTIQKILEQVKGAVDN